MLTLSRYYELISPDKRSYYLDYELIDYIVETCTYIITLNSTARTHSRSLGALQPTVTDVHSDHKLAFQSAKAAKNGWRSEFSIPGLLEKIGAPMISVLTQSTPEISLEKRVTRYDIDNLRHYLWGLEQEAHEASRNYKAKWNNATSQSTASISQTVENLETTVSALQIIRDVSTDFVIIGACALTGPLGAIAAKSLGAVAKGAAKWQDTGKLEAGAMTAAAGILTAVIPGPSSATTKGGAFALVLLEKKTELIGNVAVGLVEGKSLADSAISSTISMAGSEAFKGLSKTVGKKVFDNLPPDIVRRIVHESLDKKSIPVGIAKTGLGKLNSEFTSYSTEALIRLAKHEQPTTHRPMKQTRMALPARVDYAIVGPDVSSAFDFVVAR
jgi:hypothetical protein